MTQDLFDKPFHTITVWRTNDSSDKRSLVLTFDSLDVAKSECERQIDWQTRYPQSRRIAYIYLCGREYNNEGRTVRVVTLDTYYPAE